MPETQGWPRSSWRSAGAWCLLALVAVLAGWQARALRQPLAEARASHGAIRTDLDFYRAMAVLGPEHPIATHLREQVAPGTAVAVEGQGRFTARRQRFAIALLPDTPIASGSELVICPVPCAGPGDEELARGEEFVLLRRPDRP